MDTSNIKIVVVEDSLANLDLLEKILHDEGFIVRFATNGAQGLNVIRREMPDLILSDIRMPEMDGLEMCRELQKDETTKRIPLIFLTSSCSAEDETHALKIGAVDFIPKPINAAVLLARVYTHLKVQMAMRCLNKKNELLVENARLKDDIEQILRHDLKSPIQAVLGFPALLMGREYITHEDREMLKMIEEAGVQMLRMINFSLDLYKMERHVYLYKPVAINLLDLFPKVLNNFRVYQEVLKIFVEFTVNGEFCDIRKHHDSTIYVMGEELLLYTMFSNLLKNSFEATDDKSVIGITINVDDSHNTEVVITNEGEVPLEIRDTFFEKFSTSGKDNGTGLGTYSAFLITKTIGATMSLDSSEAGKTSIKIHFRD